MEIDSAISGGPVIGSRRRGDRKTVSGVVWGWDRVRLIYGRNEDFGPSTYDGHGVN